MTQWWVTLETDGEKERVAGPYTDPREALFMVAMARIEAPACRWGLERDGGKA